jgi:hypothetical protein
MLFCLICLASAAAAGSLEAGQPVYAIREHPDVTITLVNTTNKHIIVSLPKGGSQVLNVGPKTWIIKDNDPGTFADLQVGQHLHVWYIPRAAQGVVLEVLSPKGTK